MKRFLLISLSAVATLATLSITSCKVDKCKAIVCANGGDCDSDDGSCACPVGYEGERCETVSRDRLRGAWNVDEDGTVTTVDRYAVSIEEGNAIDQIRIRNFNNQSNSEIFATVIKDSIIIPTQTYQVGQLTKTVIGYGVAIPETFYGSHGTIKVYYRVTSSDGIVNDYGYHDNGAASVWIK